MLTRTRQAFTILELIVVIVILGILALLAIPTFNAVIGRAKDSNVKSAAVSFDRNLRALAAFDEAAPNRGEDVITAAGELFDVSMRATAGSGTAGASPAGNIVGETATTINATVVRVQFTQDDSTVCLALGTTSGVAGTVVAGGCAGFAPAVAESALFNNTGTGRTGTVQAWTVPATGTYRLSASGAEGGYAYPYSTNTINPGGLGATVTGDFALTAGHTIAIMVGHRGGNRASNGRAGGGGGGTFVVNQTTNTLLLAAGGGGGAGQYTTSFKNALTSANGSAGSNGTTSANNGGVAPNGGGTNSYASGGGGYSGNGLNNSGLGSGAISYAGGGSGGVGYTFGAPIADFDGGFGGGGGAYSGGDGGGAHEGGFGGAGGGGGYGGGGGAGGGSQELSGDGGGGGSFNGGTNQTSSVGRVGHGTAVFTSGG